ncbi:glycosyltransferase [Salinimicrobium sp. MT39]|uniref:Glycosyltransferase n=1 Tax=Salinimicrobium profundisediminis TaxID=2994553 RepID=A0A9X3I0Y3_9FLAO|nr:glycosyltransferase [Salinimicrobium profundisediminis]MCX2837908.1 glycosyltransferase [Salinimicrobium profundisediminis]
MEILEEKPIVLFILDTLEIGGAERSILEISSRFKRYKPIVVTLFKGSHLKEEYVQRGIKVISLDFEKETKQTFLKTELDKIVSSIKPLVIHATLIRSCLLSREISRSHEYVLINSLVNNTYGMQRYKTLSPIRALKLFYTQIKDAKSSSKVDFYFSNSETIKKTTSSALGLNPGKVKVIYRGRDPEIFDQVNIEKQPSNSGKNHIDLYICVGRLIKRKGQLDLVHAFAEHLIKFPDSKLILVGEGPLRKELITKITRLNLKDKVELLGQRSDVPELLSKSSYFIFPSYYEGLPGALVEAMYSKTPIIASNIPENLECINKETSLIFEPGNIKDLVSKMEMAKSIDWNGKLDLAYRKALTDFSIYKIVDEYELTYDQLLQR